MFLGAGLIAGLIEACGSTASPAIPDADSGTDAAPPDVPDASRDVVLDVDDDGPVFDPNDAGPDDGGACNTIDNVAPATSSRCRSGLPQFLGGALVSGTYYLVDVAAIATQNYCTTKFVPVSFRETANLVVDATTGVGTVDTALQVAALGVRHASATIAPSANNTSPAHVTPVCNGGDSAGDTPYTSLSVNGKQDLAIIGKYGTGIAIYRFRQQ
jgi:hypothetical protein